MQIKTFSKFRAHSEALFKKIGVFKYSHIISGNNCSFVYDFFNNNLPRLEVVSEQTTYTNTQLDKPRKGSYTHHDIKLQILD